MSEEKKKLGSKKLLLVGFGLLLLSGLVVASFSWDFNVALSNVVEWFIVLLNGNLTEDVVTQQGTFKYFLADGNGFATLPISTTSLWDTNISSGVIVFETVLLNEVGCDVKLVFDGQELDMNMDQPKVLLPITALDQRLSIGAYMNSEGACSGEVKDLNVLVNIT